MTTEKDMIDYAVNQGLLARNGNEQEKLLALAGGKPPSQATRLVELADDIGLWHTPELDAYATIAVDGHDENYQVQSRAFKRHMARMYYEQNQTTPNAQAMQDALSVLGGQAIFDRDEHQVYTRIAEHDGKIYLDLANELWEAIEISPAGWKVVSNPPVKFRRTRGLFPLPHPVDGGDIKGLRHFVNVASDEDFILLVSWLVAAIRSRGPYPLLVLHGEQGTAKSTLARVLRQLFDPNKADLRDPPKEPRDLIIAATNGWCIALDNLSHLPTWLSNALCRLSTGGGFGTRTLYENDEETLFDAQRPVILNGIEELVTRGDLLDRSIPLYLESIPEDKRRSEQEFWTEFEASRPAIMGAILGAVVVALKEIDHITLTTLPRMADFALWSVAAAPALGWTEKTFIAAYSGNRASANELTLEASLVVPPLRELVQSQDWEGTATDLLKRLHSRTEETTTKLRPWPKNGRSLSNKLRGLSANLRAAGIHVDFGQTSGSGSSRSITIKKIREISDASDASDAQPESRHKPRPEVATQTPLLASPKEPSSDAPQSYATQSDASVAKIPNSPDGPCNCPVPEHYSEGEAHPPGCPNCGNILWCKACRGCIGCKQLDTSNA